VRPAYSFLQSSRGTLDAPTFRADSFSIERPDAYPLRLSQAANTAWPVTIVATDSCSPLHLRGVDPHKVRRRNSLGMNQQAAELCRLRPLALLLPRVSAVPSTSAGLQLRLERLPLSVEGLRCLFLCIAARRAAAHSVVTWSMVVSGQHPAHVTPSCCASSRQRTSVDHHAVDPSRMYA